MTTEDILTVGRSCFCEEADALGKMADRLDEHFAEAVELLYACRGKVVVTGVGKSGHVASKIAATLASTGTASFYLNAPDAVHGDLGMLSEGDVVVAISYSGNTDELLRFIPLLKLRQIPVLAMSGNSDSLLAHYATVHLNIAVDREADPLNLAPTSSTTVTMAMGDALACALMRKRAFQPSDFARYHPGGDLGRRLQTPVAAMMVSENLPLLRPDMAMSEAIAVVTRGALGVGIVLENDHLAGILTDGDIRRGMQHSGDTFLQRQVREMMCPTPKTIQQSAKIVEAGEQMNHYSIHTLVVLDGERVVGVIDSFSCLPGTRFYH